jgi:hypothetical protein
MAKCGTDALVPRFSRLAILAKTQRSTPACRNNYRSNARDVLAHQLRQLGHVERGPPRFIFCEKLGRQSDKR